jgi:hypothetical protein
MTPKPGATPAVDALRTAHRPTRGQAPPAAPTRDALETTKRALIEFIARRRDDRIGLVVFSSTPTNQPDDIRS